MRRLACLRPYNKGEPFQRRCRRQHYPVTPQAIDHAGDDRLAPIGRGRDLRSQRQHRPHVDPVKGAQTEIYFDLRAMLAQRRRACGIIGKVLNPATDLVGKQRQHSCGHRLIGQQTSSRMAQVAELQRIAEPVRPAPATGYLRQVIGTERIKPFDRCSIGSRIEDRATLRG